MEGLIHYICDGHGNLAIFVALDPDLVVGCRKQTKLLNALLRGEWHRQFVPGVSLFAKQKMCKKERASCFVRFNIVKLQQPSPVGCDSAWNGSVTEKSS